MGSNFQNGQDRRHDRKPVSLRSSRTIWMEIWNTNELVFALKPTIIKHQAAGIYYKQNQLILFSYQMNAFITSSWNILQALHFQRQNFRFLVPASSRFFKKYCSRFPRERSREDSRLRSSRSRRSLHGTMKIRVSNHRLLLSFFVLTLLRSRKI